MADKLLGVYSKLQRADKHIADLEAAIATWKKSGPDAAAGKYDPETGCQIYYVLRLSEIPAHIPLIAGDAFNCLRSAMDHLAFQIWQRCGSQGSIKSVGFPVLDSAAGYEPEISRKIPGATQAIIDAFKAVEAYQGGNGHELWVVHRMNNIDKHRLLITAHIRSLAIIIDTSIFVIPGQPVRAMAGGGKQISSSKSLKVGDVLYVSPPGEEFDMSAQFVFQIALNEPGIVEGEPIFATVVKLSHVVRDVIKVLEPLV